MYLQLILALEKLLCSIFIHVEVEHPGLGTYTDVNGHSRWIMHVILRSKKAWVWL